MDPEASSKILTGGYNSRKIMPKARGFTAHNYGRSRKAQKRQSSDQRKSQSSIKSMKHSPDASSIKSNSVISGALRASYDA